MTTAVHHPRPGPGDPRCAHAARTEGVCDACGHCAHEVILNAACLFCATTELDPVALSPRQGPRLIEAARLIRRRT